VHHIAQLNIAKARAPLDDPMMARFVEWLEPINGLADESQGFVWRLQTDDGDATSIRPFEDEAIIPNLSVWESVEALRAFVVHPNHTRVMRESSKWFEPLDGPHLVLWWVAPGHIPSPDEGRKRLERLAALGPTPAAFSFSQIFPAP
jgi:hypothetical protein